MDIAKILIQEIQKGSVTMYRISKDTGIESSALTRLVKGERELSLRSAAALLDYFGYKIVKGKTKPLKGNTQC
jgi:plasmid maintenance system antidote protein VapI